MASAAAVDTSAPTGQAASADATQAPAAAPAAAPPEGTPAAPPSADAAPPAEAPKPTDGGNGAAPTPAPGELQITWPDGDVVDQATRDEFMALAKKGGLSGEFASELVAWQAQRVAKVEAEQDAAWKAQQKSWADEIAKDYQGEKLTAAKVNVSRALKHFGGQVDGAETNEVTRAITAMGLSDHPVLFRMFERIGAAFKDDNSRGGGAAPAQPTQAQQLHTLYPNSVNPDGTLKR